jgi:hypothetical protein
MLEEASLPLPANCPLCGSTREKEGKGKGRGRRRRERSGRPAASGGTSVGVLTCSHMLIQAGKSVMCGGGGGGSGDGKWQRRSLRLARLQQPIARNGVRLQRVGGGVHGAAGVRVRCGREQAPRACTCVLRARTLGLRRTHASGSGSSVSLHLGKRVVRVVHACAAPHERRGVLQSAAQRARAAAAPPDVPSQKSAPLAAAHVSVANLSLHALAHMCSATRQQRGVCAAVTAAPDASPNLH